MPRNLEPGVQIDLEGRLDYAEYLQLDRILGAQHPLSVPPYHDEMVFIIQHQTSELWMLLILHELKQAIIDLKNDDLSPCFKVLARIKQIQRMLFEQWAVLETLTPNEFSQFRKFLGNASGLQSYQFRMIEAYFGNRDPKMVEMYRHRPEIAKRLEEINSQPSFYDEYILLLSRKGHAVPAASLQRDWRQPYQANEDLLPVFRKIYENAAEHWAEYEMAEKLLDVDLHMSLWRFRHLKLVERIIGFKRGTGGSSGAKFLREGAEVKLFPELWDVRTTIGTSES